MDKDGHRIPNGDYVMFLFLDRLHTLGAYKRD